MNLKWYLKQQEEELLMKSVVIYYSYTGHCKKIAEDIAKKEDAQLIGLKEEKSRNKVNAYVMGSFSAMKQSEAILEPIPVDLHDFDKIEIVMPLWAGYPAPAMNNIIELLPSGKEVGVTIVSGSGNSSKSKENTIKKITMKNDNLIHYTDIKA